MKTLIQIGCAFFGSLILGMLLFVLLVSRRAELAVAEQPVAPQRAFSQLDRPPLPLPPLATNQDQIVLHAVVVAIDRAKMAVAGIDLETLQASPASTASEPAPGTPSIVSRREATLIAKLIAASGAGKILAEPTLVTNDGRAVRYHSGSAIPLIGREGKGKVAVNYREVGTSIDFTPKKLGEGKLRIEVNVDLTELDPSKDAQVEGKKVPGLKSRNANTLFELSVGQTGILRGEDLLVFVTPEIVEAPRPTSVRARPARQVDEMPFKPGIDISMVQNHALIVKFENKIPTLTIENNGVVEAQPCDPYRILITAKQPGRTKVQMLEEDGKLRTLPIHVVGQTLPNPPRPATPLKPAANPPSIFMTALIYSVDQQKLNDAGFDIHKTLVQADSRMDSTIKSRQGERLDTIVSVLSPRTVAELIRRLSSTKGTLVLSRPQVRTIDGQPAKIQFGSRVAIPGSGDVQQTTARFQDVGVTMDVVAKVIGDQLRIQATAEHAKLGGAKLESIHIEGVGELYNGETLAICQADEQNEQLLFFVTPVSTSQATSASPPKKLPQDPNSAQAKQQTAWAEREAAKQLVDRRIVELEHQLKKQHSQLQEQYSQLRSQQTQSLSQSAVADFGNTIHVAFPNAKIKVHPLPRGVFLSGTVAEPQDLAVVNKIAENYFPQVINNVTVAQRDVESAKEPTAKPHDLRAVLMELFPRAKIQVFPLNNSVVLTGNVDAANVQQVIRVAEDFYPSVINQLTEVRATRDPQLEEPRESSDSGTRGKRSANSLQQEMRELRQDVKGLRREVGRLIEMLQKDAGDPLPRKSLSHDEPTYKRSAETVDTENVNKRSADTETADTETADTETADTETADTETADTETADTETADTIWRLIGIRAVSSETASGRYRGGLTITEVRPDSTAESQRIRPGDLLVGLDHWETISSENLGYVLKQVQARRQDRLKFYILRGEETLFGHFELPDRGQETIDEGADNTVRPTAHFVDSEARAFPGRALPDPTIALQPNDRLTIESFTDKSLNRDVTILSDGTITLPLLGQVPAAGLSLERQREELETRYKRLYFEPTKNQSHNVTHGKSP